jgi:hypothetical protein
MAIAVILQTFGGFSEVMRLEHCETKLAVAQARDDAAKGGRLHLQITIDAECHEYLFEQAKRSSFECCGMQNCSSMQSVIRCVPTGSICALVRCY